MGSWSSSRRLWAFATSSPVSVVSTHPTGILPAQPPRGLLPRQRAFAPREPLARSPRALWPAARTARASRVKLPVHPRENASASFWTLCTCTCALLHRCEGTCFGQWQSRQCVHGGLEANATFDRCRFGPAELSAAKTACLGASPSARRHCCLPTVTTTMRALHHGLRARGSCLCNERDTKPFVTTRGAAQVVAFSPCVSFRVGDLSCNHLPSHTMWPRLHCVSRTEPIPSGWPRISGRFPRGWQPTSRPVKCFS